MHLSRKLGVTIISGALAFGAVGAQAAFAQPAAAAISAAASTTYADRLLQGERLEVGEELVSRNGDYRLVLEEDGSLVVRTPTGGALWETKAAGSEAYLILRADGKLVLYTGDGAPVWNTSTQGTSSVAVIQDTGHFVQYVGQEAVWYTTRQALEPDLTLPPVPASSTTSGSTTTTSGSTTTTSGTTSTVTTPPASTSTSTRDVALHPFASSSPWNRAIGSGAVFQSRSGAATTSFIESAKPVINRSSWSVSLRHARTSDPLVTLVAVRNNTTYSIRIPADTVATAGTDKHVTVIQPDGETAFDMYKLERLSSTRWSAAYVVKSDLTGSGIDAGSRASGLPAFAGLIRAHELDAANIPHAVAVAVPGTALRSGQVWPASRQDGDAATSYSGDLPMGSLVAIPGNVDLSSLPLTSPEGRALARALQNYGAYVVDRSGMVSLYCELACDSDATTRMAADWRILHSYMRVVTNNSATNVGGGGTPRVAPLAPLG